MNHSQNKPQGGTSEHFMKVEFGIEITNMAVACKFGQRCLEEFDSSLCCEITKEGSNFLYVTPVSTFKSSNCKYVRLIKVDEQKVHICTCPLRFKIYQKYRI